MKLCIPTTGKQGLNETLSEHFGSAPYFTIVNPETAVVEVIENGNLEHRHGQCNPMLSLAGKEVEWVICKGIGPGAVAKLKEYGIKVLMSQGKTVGEVFAAYQAGCLKELAAGQASCGCGCHD